MNAFYIFYILQILPTQVKHTETSAYYSNGQVYNTVEFIQDKKKVKLYYRDGSILAEGLLYNKDYRGPDQYFNMYYPDGQPEKIYNESEGIFLEYDTSHHLIKSVKKIGNERVTEEFYYSGQLKSKEIAKMDKDLGVCVYYSRQPNRHPSMHVCRSISYNSRKEYYPDGKLMHSISYVSPEEKPGVYYSHTFYLPDGKIDKSTTSDVWNVTGTVRQYYHNGQLMSIKNYENGKLKGLTQQWNAHGQLILHVKYLREYESDSCLTAWYDNGQLKMRIAYSNGVQNGPVIEYHPNGKIKKQGTNRNAFILNFDKKGKLEGVYPDLNLSQFPLFYNAFKNLNEKGNCDENGTRNGPWKGYYSTSKNLAYACNFENGVFHGPMEIYDENGHLVMSANFEEGYLNASLNYYYPNGKIFRKFIFQEKKQVQNFIYYDNGILRHQDSLVENKYVILRKNYTSGMTECKINYFVTPNTHMQSYYFENGNLNYQLEYSLDWTIISQLNYAESGRMKYLLLLHQNGKNREQINFDSYGSTSTDLTIEQVNLIERYKRYGKQIK